MDNLSLSTIIASLISAVLGATTTIYLQLRYKENKNKKIRNIAINAINILRKYSGEPYDYAKNDFNKSLNTTEKRIILVLLHKLGIPIASGIGRAFDINNIEFIKSTKINEKNLDNIKLQILSGGCDKLFFIDPDEYFNKNTIRDFKRSVAIKYVECIFSKSTYDKNTRVFSFHNQEFNEFSVGELYMLYAFKQKLMNILYFDAHTDISKPTEKTIKKIINEIKIGIWDIYLDCTQEIYNNTITQWFLASKMVEKINLQGQQMNTETLNG